MRPHRGNALVIATGATLVLVMLWAIVASTGDIPGDVAVQRWVTNADISGVAWWIPRTISFLGGPIVGAVWTAAFVAIVWPWLGWRCAALIAACADDGAPGVGRIVPAPRARCSSTRASRVVIPRTPPR